MALVVDEAHCVKSLPCVSTWFYLCVFFFCRGDSFRREFARIGEIRSIVPSNVKVMALTTTATALTRKVVISRLCMNDPFIIYVPPTKTNIFYTVTQKSSLNNIILQIADELIKFCR